MEDSNNLISFEEFKDKYIGTQDSKLRIDFDAHANQALLGTLITQMRKAANLTQEQLAQKIHNKQEYISRIESGKSDIRLSTLLKILHILNFKLQAVKLEG
ncbi:MAG: helix-turn-helix transcriptional regulator [Bacteroidota bacterium]